MSDMPHLSRSTVYASNGMAATSMPQATLTALDVLRAGGNALDAAVAAAAVLSVVEPQSTGIGGDCFCLYAPAGTKQVVAMNGSGRSPAGVTLEGLLAKGVSALTESSPHVVTVPGAVAAWEKLLAAHGTKGLDELLRPAIGYAENGYIVHPRVAGAWHAQAGKLVENGAQDFLIGGKAPVAGTVMHQKDLARTLKAIAEHGARAFYEGEIASSMVRELRGRGGFHTEQDFANGLETPEFVTPITTRFAGHDIWECPPNGSGLIALMLMGIMDGIKPTADPLDPLRLHRHVEAARLVYRDRDAFLADPNHMTVSVEQLLGGDYIAGLRNLIDDTKALEFLPPAGELHRDTVYLSVVDRDGNACSFINSLFEGFGSGIAPPGTGVMLQNRGMGFRMQAGHPSVIAPNKRPMHTIIPAMATKDGLPTIVFGVMGGHFQPMGQSWVLSSLLQYGLSPQAAIDLPRIFPSRGVVQAEAGIPNAALAALAALGHDVRVMSQTHGGGQMIVIDRARGVLLGASDPRKDGCALGY